MGTLNPSQRLIDPYVKITIGKLGDQNGDTFTVGDGKLIKASVTLGEGKATSNCSFTVLDPDKKLADKYFSYIEKVGGLDPVVAPKETVPQVKSITNSVVNQPDQTNTTAGKLIYSNVQASTYDGTGATGGGSTGAWGDTIDFSGNYAAMVNPMYKYATMRVTNLDNNKSVLVKVIDTGPFAVDSSGHTIYPLRENDTRKIDLTPGAFIQLAPLSQGIINVNIEWVEAGITTSASSNKSLSTQQVAQQQNQDIKSNQAVTNPFVAEQIGDWPKPQVGPTKTIILIPGHLVDTNSGGGGTTTYNGETRSVESVATMLTVQVAKDELAKAGYICITPTTTSRGLLVNGYNSPQQQAFLDSVAALKLTNGLAYAVELHFDDSADGGGSAGLIPERLGQESTGSSLSVMSVALGKEFGTFPYGWREILGAERRGISQLEVSIIAPFTSLITSGNYTGFQQAILPYAQRIVKAFNTVTGGVANNANQANSSVNNAKTPQIETPPVAVTLAGSQITIEMGYSGKTIAAYSFIHTGLKFSLFEPDALEFTGQAALWVLNQRVKNTVYTNVSLKKIAKSITSAYGMKLEMPEEGPTYEYFPQRGQTDYEALLIEARRIGYRVYCKGPTLYIQPRSTKLANSTTFVLEYGDNMGTSFIVTHQAQSDSKGGARSSMPGANNTTGIRKFDIDPASGKVVQTRKENLVGTGRDGAVATTGSPIKAPAPKTTGLTDKQDADRKANEDRIKGIIATAEFPTTPEALTLDPDTPFLTKGISNFLDRMWVVENITHEYQPGLFVTKLTCYSPLKNKHSSAVTPVSSITNSVVSTTTPGVTSAKPGFLINPMKVGAYRTSSGGAFGAPRGNHTHKGQDLSAPSGTPFYASADGTVTFAGATDLGGYGTLITIQHPNNIFTRYGHPSKVYVSTGDQVKQGQLIGLVGATGDSTGPHLHFEVRPNDTPVDPKKYINF